MIDMTPEVSAESAQLRAAIWRELQGHNPAAAADALAALLVYVVKRNARDPAAMIGALVGNLTIAADVDAADPATAKPLVSH